MPVPKITIRAQRRTEKIISVHFVVSDPGATVTVELPAAAIPNGAVGKPAMAVTPNVVGECAAEFTAMATGDYAPAIVRAVNSDGEATATTWPMTLFPAGQMPPGSPRALLPSFVAPTFSAAQAAVALNAKVTDFTLQSMSVSNETNVPFTFGQPFRAGDLAPGDFLVGRIDGEADIPLQFNVRATWQNGSVRHAVISGLLPALAAGASKNVSLIRSSTGASTAPLAASAVLADGLTAQVNLTIGGVVYSANPGAALAAMSTPSAIVGGAIANEYLAMVPFKDGANAEHPHLMLQAAVRRYAGTSKAKIDITIEHAKAYAATADIGYTGEVLIADVSRMSIGGAAGGELIHYPCARWKRSFWWGNASPVHIRHNVRYLLDSRALPNYDMRQVVPEATMADHAARLADPLKFWPMRYGSFQPVFGATGGRADIGLAPGWYAAAVLSQDPRSKALMLASGDCGGSFFIHRRDDVATSPLKGYPIQVNNFPRITLTSASAVNVDTGQNEKPPTTTSIAKTSQQPLYQAPDSSHQPSIAYIPYLLTGDWFYLEELHFWTSWNLHQMNPSLITRGGDRGWTAHGQVRGQGWDMRTMAQCAAITPDNHPLKPSWEYYYQNNLSKYNADNTDNPSANALGVTTSGGAIIYSMVKDKVLGQGNTQISGTTMPDTGIGLFQDDFFTSGVGIGAELGYSDALRLLKWKSKFPIQRMTAAGVSWWRAAYPQSFAVRPSETAPLFTTIKEAHDFTHSVASRTTAPDTQAYLDLLNFELDRPANDLVFNQMTGHTGTISYSANMQPALAMSVDAGVDPAACALAWSRFDSRAKQPAYGESPQFSIVPRGIVLDIPPAPDPEPEIPPTPDPEPPPVSAGFSAYRAGQGALGGGVSVVSSETVIFGPVNEAESGGGVVKYRCEYVRNGFHATVYGAILWLSENTPSPGTVVEVGLGTSAINGVEQVIADEFTPPNNVAFTLGASKATGILLGDMPPGAVRAVWYRLTCSAGTAATPVNSLDTFTRTVEGTIL